MAEYGRAYNGPPSPSMAWLLVVALANYAFRFDSRLEYHTQRAVASGIAAAFGESDELARDELRRAAYPLKRTAPLMAFVQPKNVAPAEPPASGPEDSDG